MPRTLLLALLLLLAAEAPADEPLPRSPVAAADASHPEPGGLSSPPSFDTPDLARFELTLPAPAAPPCEGPLEPGAPPCRWLATLGTAGGWFVLGMLRPADQRLAPASSISPRRPGLPTLRGGADAAPGLWVGGFEPDPTFVGLGAFDMRTRPAP